MFWSIKDSISLKNKNPPLLLGDFFSYLCHRDRASFGLKNKDRNLIGEIVFLLDRSQSLLDRANALRVW